MTCLTRAARIERRLAPVDSEGAGRLAAGSGCGDLSGRPGLRWSLLALLFELLTIDLEHARSGVALLASMRLSNPLAAALIVGLNWFSFQHYARFDWTRHHQFTLPKRIQDQLKEL